MEVVSGTAASRRNVTLLQPADAPRPERPGGACHAELPRVRSVHTVIRTGISEFESLGLMPQMPKKDDGTDGLEELRLQVRELRCRRPARVAVAQMAGSGITSDVVILGAGAAGLMCAIEAGKRGRSVLVLERNPAIGQKIRISGGGRCNFTNMVTEPGHYLSDNMHFCKSALARYTPDDFIALVRKHGIAFHEK